MCSSRRWTTSPPGAPGRPSPNLSPLTRYPPVSKFKVSRMTMRKLRKNMMRRKKRSKRTRRTTSNRADKNLKNLSKRARAGPSKMMMTRRMKKTKSSKQRVN